MTKTYDLTTGSLAKHFMRLAIPAAIGMVFSTLYNVVDVFFAGMIGTDAQAGLAISFQAFFIFVTIGFGLSAAMTVSNEAADQDWSIGAGCIGEYRAMETIQTGEAKLGFMQPGDRLRMELFDRAGNSVMGAIDQVAVWP